MKKLITFLALCALLISVPSCSVLNGTGKRPTWQATVYLSFADTWAVTSAAYDGYCELAVQGKVSAADQKDIDEAWNKFRAAISVSFKAASRDWSAVTPEDVRQLSNDLIILIRSL